MVESAAESFFQRKILVVLIAEANNLLAPGILCSFLGTRDEGENKAWIYRFRFRLHISTRICIFWINDTGRSGMPESNNGNLHPDAVTADGVSMLNEEVCKDYFFLLYST